MAPEFMRLHFVSNEGRDHCEEEDHPACAHDGRAREVRRFIGHGRRWQILWNLRKTSVAQYRPPAYRERFGHGHAHALTVFQIHHETALPKEPAAVEPAHFPHGRDVRQRHDNPTAYDTDKFQPSGVQHAESWLPNRWP